MINDYLSVINAVVCGLISLRLITFDKTGLNHRPFMSFIAYVIIVATGSVPIRMITGDPVQQDISQTLLNIIMCIALFAMKGNVATFLKWVAHEDK